MTGLALNSIGILPPGALGVAFAAHLSDGFRQLDGLALLARSESRSAAALGAQSDLLIEQAGGVRARRMPPRLPPLPDLGEAPPPSVILAAPLPDQLFGVLRDLVAWLSAAVERAGWEAVAPQVPVVVVASNGIYFQRLRRSYLELLEEAVMLGSLPDLWPDRMPLLIGRLIRGVTLQTGLRTGEGAKAVYRPGPPGLTTLVGGDAAVREAVERLLAGRGMRLQQGGDASPTRIEFDKALVNLAGNLFGQIHCLDGRGRFARLTIGEIHQRVGREETLRLVRHVVAIGQAIRIYPADFDPEDAYRYLERLSREHADHVPSGVQLLEAQLARGSLRAEVPSTEGWLLNPLLNYA
ncbi:MAG: hypothetical protein ACOC3I_11600, partial [Verrucomicrobiota bacterium]